MKNDWTLLSIVSIVALVAFAGFLSFSDFSFSGDGLTGNVVQELDDCGECKGTPVCAVKSGRAVNYENGCAAVCDDARVLSDGICERL